MNSPQLLDSAQALHRAGRLAEAETLYARALMAAPQDYAPHYLLGVLRLHQGRDGEAAELFAAAARIKPDAVEALSGGGLALQRSGRMADALAMFDRALAILPGDPQNLVNRANALHLLGRFEEALADYGKALAIVPDAPGALLYRGHALSAAGRFEEALADYDRALAVKPDFAAALCGRGNMLRALGRPEEAMACYERALQLQPGDPDALGCRGEALLELWRFEEALASFNQAIAAHSGYPEAFLGRGIALEKLHRPGEAVASYDRALALQPDFTEAFFRRGIALDELGYFEEAIASYDGAIARHPRHTHAMNNRCVVLQKLRRFAEAAKGYEAILAIEPEHRLAFGGLASCALHACDWSRRGEFIKRMRDHILGDKSEIQPGTLLGYSGDAALQLACARNYLVGKLPPPAAPLWRGKPFSRDRIRIAYCSADFHSKPMPRLMAGMFEHHDRDKFEVIAVSYGIDDGSEMRKRLVKAFDQFHDVQSLGDRETAELLASLDVDIAIDLMGFTDMGRNGVFARRPAPVQVNYMGFPGTLGANFIDYIIADRIVLPLDRQPFYAEKIVQLPDSYLANDDRREAAGIPPPRSEAGLPEQGFVFCCFNNNWKINAPLFDIWMRLLHAVPGSVLWLLEDNDEAAGNLRREAAERGIAPERLVFAPRTDAASHLARHRLADLFLDTLPYNAHTTASDSLWAGVPLVTCLGEGFQGRVGASVLHAVGLAELVAEDLGAYEALALALARDPERLAAVRRKLENNRATAPLFDTARFTRGMETAFVTMRDAWRQSHIPA